MASVDISKPLYAAKNPNMAESISKTKAFENRLCDKLVRLMTKANNPYPATPSKSGSLSFAGEY